MSHLHNIFKANQGKNRSILIRTLSILSFKYTNTYKITLQVPSQPSLAFSRSTIETLKQGVKYVQSQHQNATKKTPKQYQGSHQNYDV